MVQNLGLTRGHTYWAPNLNIFRDPRWGRGQETPGEDPTLNAAYGANFISGFQGSAQTTGQDQPPASSYSITNSDSNSGAPVPVPVPVSLFSEDRKPETSTLKASACAKHFFGYSLENCFEAKDNCRLNFNANMTQQEIEDTYLPAFEAAVKVGKVSGLMCSENAVNGIPACANAWAMTTVARQSWGGDFYVTGDCGAVDVALQPYPTEDTWPPVGAADMKGHGYTLPPNVSFESAGLDSDCRAADGQPSKALGTPSDQSAALARLFRTEFRLGRFDPLESSPYNALALADLGTHAHQVLAREACQQSIVLLKNADNTLPLSPNGSSSSSSSNSSSSNNRSNSAHDSARDSASSSSASAKLHVAMIGPNWEVKEGGYSGKGSGGKYTLSSPDAIAGYLNNAAHPHPPSPPSVTVIPGCVDAACESDGGDGFAAAVAAAKVADVVMLAVGIDDSFEGENGDRRALSGLITLPGQ